MEVACGQCLGCRLDYSRMWAMRIVHESGLYEVSGGNCFVTLTYRDRLECDEDQLRNGYHIPDDWSLHKKHFQDFMKRLRKHFEPRKIRFFMAGEYGNRCKHAIDLERVGCPLCNVGRPHYHVCLFNCDFPDLEAYGSNHDGGLRYTSPLLESIWKYGFVDVGELNFESGAYVARYCLKKRTGVVADSWYQQCDLDGVVTYVTPEFCLMSRGRPCKVHRHIQVDCSDCEGGIGWRWFSQFKDDVFPSDEVPVPGYGVIKGVPRYYQELFKIEEPLTLEEIKAVRKEFMKAHGEDYTPERLYDRYRVKKAQIQYLQRS